MRKKVMWKKALAIALMPMLIASGLGTIGATAKAVSDEELELEIVEDYAPEEAPETEDEIVIEDDPEAYADPDTEEAEPEDDLDIVEEDAEFLDHTFFWKSAKNKNRNKPHLSKTI